MVSKNLFIGLRVRASCIARESNAGLSDVLAEVRGMTAFTFTTLGGPPGNTGIHGPFGINDVGQIVGSYYDATGGPHGFLLSGGIYTTIDDPQAVADTDPLGINNAGLIVGLDSHGTGFQGFLYNPNGGTYTALIDPLASFAGTVVAGINDAGQIVGYGFSSGVFIYNANDGTYTHITLPGSPNGINNAGQIVGGYGDASGRLHGFLYNLNDGTYATLDDPFGAKETDARGINDAGQVVGDYLDSNGVQHGFLYTVGTFITLDDPLAGFFGTVAYGINDTEVVGASDRGGFITTIGPNLPPPSDTTAVMILRHGADGLYAIYDIGNNSILLAYQLGQVGTDWQFAVLGDFNGVDTSDMLLRNSTTGGFEVYNIANNQITNAAFMGTVGLDWQAMGFGNFSSSGDTDMMLRNANTGGIEVYDIKNNQIIGASFGGRSAWIGRLEASAISAASPARAT